MLKSKPKVLPPRNSSKFVNYMREYWQYYALILPAVVFLAIFAYAPMYGIQIAFRDYKAKQGYWGSEWVGLKHFIRFVSSENFWPLIRNTLAISVANLVWTMGLSIIVSLMLNEVRQKKTKAFIQMVTYAPYFMSVMVVVSMVKVFTDPDSGIVNLILGLFGKEPINFLLKKEWFVPLHVISCVWQDLGFATIIYLATLAGVDPQIVEAATVDGANRFQKIIHIDLPTIFPTIVTLFILNCGGLLNVGYERVLLMQSPLTMEVADTISTYVYRLGIEGGQFSYTTAIGLFNSIVNVILVVTANKLSKTLTETSLW